MTPNCNADELNEIWGILDDVITSLETVRDDLRELEEHNVDFSIYPELCEEYLDELRSKQEEVGKQYDQAQRKENSNNNDF